MKGRQDALVAQRRHLLDLPDEVLVAIGRAVQQLLPARGRRCGCTPELLTLSTLCRRLHRVLADETLRELGFWQTSESSDVDKLVAYSKAMPHRMRAARQLFIAIEVDDPESIAEDLGVDEDDDEALEAIVVRQSELGRQAMAVYLEVPSIIAKAPLLESLHVQTSGGWLEGLSGAHCHHFMLAVAGLAKIKSLQLHLSLALLHWQDILVHLPVGLEHLFLDRRSNATEMELPTPRCETLSTPNLPALRTLRINTDPMTRQRLFQTAQTWQHAPWSDSLMSLHFDAFWERRQDCPDPSNLWKGCKRLTELILVEVLVDAVVIGKLPASLIYLSLRTGSIDGKALMRFINRGQLPALRTLEIKGALDESQIAESDLQQLKVRILRLGANEMPQFDQVATRENGTLLTLSKGDRWS